MAAIVILSVLIIGLIAFDLAALRWGVDSRDGSSRSDFKQRCWRGVHGN